VRPHPFESPEPYQEGLKDLPNVVINTTGPPQIPLFGSVASIQRSSTIGIESRMTDTPTFSPRWIPPPCPEIRAVEDVSIPFERYEELRSTLAAVWGGSFRVPEPVAESSRTVIRDRFYVIDGKAHVRVAEAVMEHVPARRQVDEAMCDRFLHGLEADSLPAAQRLARGTRRLLGLSPEWSFRAFREIPEIKWGETDQYFDAPGVQAILERIRAAESKRGVASAAVTVAPSRELGVYASGFRGTGVTVRPA
jgi:hypothetical protein